MDFVTQVKNNSLAIISVIIALVALSYNTWRDETTERNRNYRTAAFEVLKNLGALQIAVNYMHYQPDNAMANPFIAWSQLSLIGDLGKLLPSPVPERVQELLLVWNNDWTKIKTDQEATEKITQEINATREAVLDVTFGLR